VGERCVWWVGFRAECLGWRRVNSWVDGWLKGWESRVAGFGWSGLQLVPPTPGICVADLLPDTGQPEDEVIVTTLAGDIFVLDANTLATKWRTHVPGAAGFYNSIKVTDHNNDFKMELYVAGSFGVWRFTQP
jgi:hypothetical protein